MVSKSILPAAAISAWFFVSSCATQTPATEEPTATGPPQEVVEQAVEEPAPEVRVEPIKDPFRMPDLLELPDDSEFQRRRHNTVDSIPTDTGVITRPPAPAKTGE